MPVELGRIAGRRHDQPLLAVNEPYDRDVAPAEQR